MTHFSLILVWTELESLLGRIPKKRIFPLRTHVGILLIGKGEGTPPKEVPKTIRHVGKSSKWAEKLEGVVPY